ncbi:hypothetical protein CRYO30217_00004 [Parvicella tangerina]|uniref:Uncharacterized protein n=1 Tax=Parvicella tangerina TaxID=2829795 RepID=A0A916JJE6_9FLAO|nr:hypothetical protein CRYO30217_00004 [Parvicella tangerina]
MNESTAYRKIQEIKKFIKESNTTESNELIESIEEMEKSHRSNEEILNFLLEFFSKAIRNRTINDLLDDEN